MALFGAAAARAKVTADTPDTLSGLTSIGDALNAPDHHPVHILYVHGIDAVGAGGSWLLRQSICERLKLCQMSDWKNAGVEFADHGDFADGADPPPLLYLDTPVWRNAGEWRAAAPFVVHWVVHLRNHPSVLVVDEINWWPLLLSLKCRRVVAAEPYLAGPDRAMLQLCSEQKAQDPDNEGRFYPWIAPDQAAKLAAMHPRGVLINRTLKQSLIDWGLADVMLAVGQMSGILRDGLRQLMAKSAAFDPNQTGQTSALGNYNWRAQLRQGNIVDQEFVGVTHSLGAYLLFNTLTVDSANATDPGRTATDAARRADEDNAVRYLFERTSRIYFFANQLQMLEITNLEIGQRAPADAVKSRGLEEPPPPVTAATNFRGLVNRWKDLETAFQAAVHPADVAARQKVQVVAWSDPSDVITWRVPCIGNVDVVNLYVQNAHHWLGILESPGKAHTTYARNLDVLRVMFNDTVASAAR